jgi:hypothetical protein
VHEQFLPEPGFGPHDADPKQMNGQVEAPSVEKNRKHKVTAYKNNYFVQIC